MIKHIADYLRTYRRYKGLSMETFARAIKMTHKRADNLEAGRTKHTLETLGQACSFYGLNLSTVFEFAEIAEQLGIKEAYKSEAPHLLEFHRPYTSRKARTTQQEITC